MKLIMLAAMLVCAGCASTYHEQGAFKGAGGFKDTSSRPNHHDITYVGGNTLDPTISMVFSLRRAAELAKADGKPMFIVREKGGKIVGSTMTTMMNGGIYTNTNYTPIINLTTESALRPAGPVDGVLYFDADAVMRLTQPYVDNGEAMLKTVRGLNDRLREPGSAANAEVQQQLYSSLMFSTNLKSDDVLFRQGYLAGLFRNKMLAQQWAMRDYLPTGQTMIALGLKLAGQEELLANFMQRYQWSAQQQSKITSLDVATENMVTPLAKGMQAATGDNGIMAQRNEALMVKLLEFQAALRDTGKPGKDRAMAYENASRMMTVLATSNQDQTAGLVAVMRERARAKQVNLLEPVVMEDLFLIKLPNNVGAMAALQPVGEPNARRVLTAARVGQDVMASVLLTSQSVKDARLTVDLFSPKGEKHNLIYYSAAKDIMTRPVRTFAPIKADKLAEPGMYSLVYTVRGERPNPIAKGTFYFPVMSAE